MTQLHISINSDFDSDGSFIFSGYGVDNAAIITNDLEEDGCEALYDFVKSLDVPPLDCSSVEYHWNAGKPHSCACTEYLITDPKLIAMILMRFA